MHTEDTEQPPALGYEEFGMFCWLRGQEKYEDVCMNTRVRGRAAKEPVSLRASPKSCLLPYLHPRV